MAKFALRNIDELVVGCLLVILLLNLTMISPVSSYTGKQSLMLERAVSATEAQTIKFAEVGQISSGKTILGLEVIS